MINFAQFIAFAAIARNRSVTKAAQALRVSQPAISKHLKNLEQHYGAKFIEREAGLIELTDAGRILMRRVDAVLSQLEELEQELKSQSDFEASEPLKIAGSYTASAVLLPSLIVVFQKRHNGVRIILRTGATNSAKRMLLNSEVELAVINEDPGHPNLVAELFRKEKIVIFVAPAHPMAKKSRVDFSDLNAARIIATGGRGRLSVTEKALKRLGEEVKLKIAIRCGTPEAVKALVKKGLGVGILYADSVMPEIRKKVFKQLKFRGASWSVQTYLVYYKDRLLSANAREFLTLLREQRER